MEISALSSGSSGNAFYIQNRSNNSAILVDCGISAKQIVNRLESIKKVQKLLREFL